MRRARRFAAASVAFAVAAFVLVVPVGPASAGIPGSSPGGTPPAVDNGPVRKTVRTCRLYASQSSFGLSCGNVTSGAQTIRQILGGDPLPRCWHEPIPAELRAEYDALAAERIARGEKGHYYMTICLEGIDPVTLQEIGEVKFTEKPDWLPDPQEPTTLTERQKTLVSIQQKDRVYPAPTLATSPTVTPRVGQDVAFYLPRETEVPEINFVRNGQVVGMRARVVHLSVVPEPGAPRLECDGGGIRVKAGDTPENTPEACWYRYEHSSAGEEGNAYRATGTAYWVVEYRNGDVWQQMATFEKASFTLQEVSEVQTLVVS